MKGTHDKTWLKEILKPLAPAFREVMVMSLFVNLLALGLPIFVLQVYDRVVFYKGTKTLVALVAGVAIVILFDYVLRQARSRVLQKAALLIDIELGRALFDKVSSLPLRTLEDRPSNYWNSLFHDADTVRNMFSGPTAVLAAELPFIPIFIIIVFVIAEPIAWVLVVIVPIFLIVAWVSGNMLSGANKQERERQLDREAMLAEMLGGRTTMKALAIEKGFRDKWEKQHAGVIKRSLTRGFWSDSFANLSMSLSFITTVSLTTVGALAILDQRLSIGALIATNMLSNRLIQPLNQFVNTWRNYALYKQSIERLSEAFALAEERKDSTIELARPQGEIELENISFSFAPDTPKVIDGITMRIRPGGMIGLIGPNGSGKTTLMKLMLGLYEPTQGRVLLDGADITQFTRADLAPWFGYVPQEAALFHGSIRDNISGMDPDADDADIVEASKAAGAHGFISDLPDGYGTDIGEAGMRLSGGQRQRIAVARALLHDPPILLLDEVAASLDRDAEHALRDTLVDLAKTRTVVVSTHTPALLVACRHIVGMEKGKVAIAGPTREVLAKMFGQPKKAVEGQPDTPGVNDEAAAPSTAESAG
jgi:ATP-binding cassette subfamily C protein LapB